MNFFVRKMSLFFLLPALASLCACQTAQHNVALMHQTCGPEIQPKRVTEPTPNDTDDPAIWINPVDPGKSLILGTDKDRDGGLYVFDLQGRILRDKSIYHLKRPNNVDIEYGLILGGEKVDIAVVTERLSHKLRVFTLPDMTPVDGGGLDVFVGQTGEKERDLMGIALYKRPQDGAVFAVVGRKTGTSGTYLWQYYLHDDGFGRVQTTLVRQFGTFSGINEIEAIAVDDALGYIYYSDEGFGVRKYYADPVKGNQELAVFATEGFTEDHEGIAIYCETPGTGYILVSDQAADKFHIFPREGMPGNPHQHPLLKIIATSTTESDGSEATPVPLGKMFPKGLFVAMSDDRTFQYYSWADIIGDLGRSAK